MIRLIISDIDGTLVPEGGNNLNSEYIDVIKELTRCGVRFAAASGRQASSIDAMFHEVSDQIYYLSDNGAFIQKDGMPVREVLMNQEDAAELIKDAKQIPDCHILLSAKDGYYIDNATFYEKVMKQYRGTGDIVKNLTDYADICIKLSFYRENGSQILYDTLYERWKDKFSINISGARWLDVNDFTATKGNAARWIQEHMRISSRETVVFGDNFNDISMLECSERSYASVLSHPDVKKAAKYEVASYKEDGVLQVMKQILEEIKREQ